MLSANQVNFQIGFVRGQSGAELPFAAVVRNPALHAGYRMGRHAAFKRIVDDHAEISKINWTMGFNVGRAGGKLTLEQALNSAALTGYNTGKVAANPVDAIAQPNELDRFTAPVQKMGIKNWFRSKFTEVGVVVTRQEMLDAGYTLVNITTSAVGIRNPARCGNGITIEIRGSRVNGEYVYTRVK